MLEMWEVAEELGNIACRGAVSGEKEGYVKYQGVGDAEVFRNLEVSMRKP